MDAKAVAAASSIFDDNEGSFWNEDLLHDFDSSFPGLEAFSSS